MDLSSLREPVIAAPMAGGPTTVDLTVAVSEAGGLGFLAGGYLTPDALRDQIRRVRASTAAAFGVNLFVPDLAPIDGPALAEYSARIRPEARRLGAALGEPVGGDDFFAEKVAVLREERVGVVSFAFGLPSPEVVGGLREGG